MSQPTGRRGFDATLSRRVLHEAVADGPGGASNVGTLDPGPWPPATSTMPTWLPWTVGTT